MTKGRLITTLILAAIVLAGAGFIWLNQNSWDEGTRIASYFIISVFGAILVGLFVMTILLPKIGDTVGEFFYSSGELQDQDDSMAAISLVAQGDYEGAIEEYEKVANDNPGDPAPIWEIAKLRAEKLEDPDAAAEGLSAGIEAGEWSADDAAFLLNRLADVHAQHRGDFDSARALVGQIEADFEGRHQANAAHRLRKLDEEEFLAKQAAEAEAARPEQSAEDWEGDENLPG